MLRAFFFWCARLGAYLGRGEEGFHQFNSGLKRKKVGMDFQAVTRCLLGAENRTHQLQDDKAVRLNEIEMYELMDRAGLKPCAGFFLPLGEGESQGEDWARQALAMAEPTGRMLLKVVGREILHKTDVGGVAVLKVEGMTVSDLLQRVREMRQTLIDGGLADSVEGFLAGEFVPHSPNTPGQEVLLSLKQDPAFGPCVVVGVGGTLTEWYGKGTQGQSTLILPASGMEEATVEKALESHPLLSLLCVPSRLYRQAPLETRDLVHWIMALGQLGAYFGPGGPGEYTLEELEINPAVATEKGLTALDGVGLVSRRKWRLEPRPVQKIQPLLNPRSAVILGVSAKGSNPGRVILENLKRSDGVDSQRLYVVHPKESSIAGVPCFASVAAVPEKCDLAVVSVPAQGALEAINQLVEQDKAESIILIPGGFAEAGEKDLAERIENVLLEGHRQPGGGPVMVGGNCLGIVSRNQYNTFFLPHYKLPFNPGAGENLAVVSQSGAYAVTFASNYDGIINPRASISFGNQMDLTVSDFVEHFTAIEGVNVIACYVEGFRSGDGLRFLEKARLARQAGKTVIIFKAGKTALGAKAAASHTASLAGDYAVAKSCLESAGIVVAETLDDFEDLIKTFTLLAGKRYRGNRVGIISNAGFECSAVMDQLQGLKLATFDAPSQKVLDEVLPSYTHRANPIDCTPITATGAFCDSCQALMDSETVDVAILSSVPVTPALNNLPADAEGRHREDMAAADSQPSRMIAICQASSKPAVIAVDSGRIFEPMRHMIEKAGIPVFRKIDRAARALATYCNAVSSSRGEN
ncbi:hypothetical protein CSA17_01755 [bacterium DOLJORAL78_65_58]|nr:MAG: hypothetical protein CSB20_05935 [bacterium DOLZORAL124_64_63]PIE76529.1 MAG: hypothetical protein CSA17_01755 [bacterium DOLJORAL78_65_58]